MASADFMTPRRLFNSDGNYAAQDQAMYSLRQYMEIGEWLPDTMEAYQERLGLYLGTVIVFEEVLQPLLEAYSRVKSDSNECRDQVYPSIIRAADFTSGYARYAVDMTPIIFQLIRDLADTTDEARARDLNEEINSLINQQLKNVDVLIVHSHYCCEFLRELEERSRVTQELVKQRSDAMHKMISRDPAKLQNMEKIMHFIRLIIGQNSAQYALDELLECTTQSYAWLGLSGLIVSSAVASIRGSEATEIADLLDDTCQSYFVDPENREYMFIGADLDAIASDLDRVLDDISPAIGAVEQMLGSWTAISSDLSNLLEMVQNDIKGANQYIAILNEKKIISDWKDLADAVARYQGAAQSATGNHNSAPTSISMTDLARQLRLQAGQ
ncbi:hypothetical protein GGG16DRAFT_113956 [Schizophyllum commune]